MSSESNYNSSTSASLQIDFISSTAHNQTTLRRRTTTEEEMLTLDSTSSAFTEAEDSSSIISSSREEHQEEEEEDDEIMDREKSLSNHTLTNKATTKATSTPVPIPNSTTTRTRTTTTTLICPPTSFSYNNNNTPTSAPALNAFLTQTTNAAAAAAVAASPRFWNKQPGTTTPPFFSSSPPSSASSCASSSLYSSSSFASPIARTPPSEHYTKKVPSPFFHKLVAKTFVREATVKGKEAQRFNDSMVYLEGPQVYTCAHCRTHLTTHDDIISKSFHGRHGRAYLFDQCANIKLGPAEDRMLITGLHSVCDIFCKRCQSLLGWTYAKAYEFSQKYKEGKFIIEKINLFLEESRGRYQIGPPAGERSDRWRMRSIGWTRDDGHPRRRHRHDNHDYAIKTQDDNGGRRRHSSSRDIISGYSSSSSSSGLIYEYPSLRSLQDDDDLASLSSPSLLYSTSYYPNDDSATTATAVTVQISNDHDTFMMPPPPPQL